MPLQGCGFKDATAAATYWALDGVKVSDYKEAGYYANDFALWVAHYYNIYSPSDLDTLMGVYRNAYTAGLLTYSVDPINQK